MVYCRDVKLDFDRIFGPVYNCDVCKKSEGVHFDAVVYDVADNVLFDGILCRHHFRMAHEDEGMFNLIILVTEATNGLSAD